MTVTLDHKAVTVLRAIIAGHVTRSDIQAATGLTESVVHTRMHQLRNHGVIDWVDGCLGTTRALVREELVQESKVA